MRVRKGPEIYSENYLVLSRIGIKDKENEEKNKKMKKI